MIVTSVCLLDEAHGVVIHYRSSVTRWPFPRESIDDILGKRMLGVVPSCAAVAKSFSARQLPKIPIIWS